MSDAFRKEVVLPDRAHYFVNWYTYQSFAILQFIAALQGWIFGMCYLKSATASSFKVSWLTVKKITAFGLIVGVLFLFCELGFEVVLFATFPGYND